ncbi:UDP-N-acetylglucosamine 2-epimerase [Rhizobacter sp. LjRoot28]|uniref:UDP-N-acetylglucosamine 2-epimerase n=1 Tax=Rhizobacter sp. LjRoot28 TaxID=3342309 RepID=UPI003ECE92E0
MTGARKVCYLSGTRADFGLMAATLRAMDADPRLEVSVLVTGMHLSTRHGHTVDEIERSGLRIAARVPVDMSVATQAVMARNVGIMLQAFVSALEADRPDLLLLLGDRGEMLAGALAAIHLAIPVAHIHGGERSGTVDEPVRHAISKLSHLHLVATDEARDRLVRMGERGCFVTVTGAPGLDGLPELAASACRLGLCADMGLDSARPVAIFLYHPVLNEVRTAARDARAGIEAARAAGCQVLALMPNADAGSDNVRDALDELASASRIVLRTHMPRQTFVGWLAHADVLIGNSSSGIIEAATFGLPVVNIGSRQNMRERNANVIDVAADPSRIEEAVRRAVAGGRQPPANVYGDGRAAARIVDRLATVALDASLLDKCNAY